MISPEYCTGRELWLLGMPSTLSPADPAWERGQVSAVVRSPALGAGLVSVFSGGPTDAFSIRIEIVAGGALGIATFRWRLLDTEAWSLTTLVPADPDALGYSVYELPESGITVRFAGTFVALDGYAILTTESPQQLRLRRAISGEMARKLRVRGALPLADWADDIKLIAARLIAYELCALRGFDPQSPHDKMIIGRADWARSKLTGIAEELEQSDLAGQSTVPGVAASSQDPQGVDLW